MIVLDASAVLAVMRDESGGNRVTEAMPAVVIAAVNHSEVLAKLIDYGMTPQGAVEELDRMKLYVRPFDLELSELAGRLRGPTARFGLSLGDRACLALASSLNCPAMTTDRIWDELDIGVEIRLLR